MTELTEMIELTEVTEIEVTVKETGIVVKTVLKTDQKVALELGPE